MDKHLTWVMGLMCITITICSTLVFLNHNAWTVRFEMDENTRTAIESIEYPIVDVETVDNNFPNFTTGDRIPCDCYGCYAMCYNITINDVNVGEGVK